MTTHRTPSETIRAIGAALEQINRDKLLGETNMGHAIDLLLEAREALMSDFRLAMVKIELAINDFIRAQPGSSEAEDQRLMDLVTDPLNWIWDSLPELEKRERPGQRPLH